MPSEWKVEAVTGPFDKPTCTRGRRWFTTEGFWYFYLFFVVIYLFSLLLIILKNIQTGYPSTYNSAIYTKTQQSILKTSQHKKTKLLLKTLKWLGWKRQELEIKIGWQQEDRLWYRLITMKEQLSLQAIQSN